MSARRDRAAGDAVRQLYGFAAAMLGLRLMAAIDKHQVYVDECPLRHRPQEGLGTWWAPICTVCGPLDDVCTQHRGRAESYTTEGHRAELARGFLSAIERISPTPKGKS